MTYKKYDYDSYQIYTIQTDKFKNCYIEVNFRDDVRELNVCQRNFLNNVMVYSSLKYPSKRKMLIAQEELYNADFGGGSSRVGYNIFSSFSLDFLHPKFILEEDYLDKCLEFFFQNILNPNIHDQKFDDEVVQIIKERTHVNIDRYKENASSFAKVDSRNILFPDSFSGKQIRGTHEEVDAISPSSLYEEYLAMLQNAHCEILVIGELDMDMVAQKIARLFHKNSIVQKEIPFTIDNPIQSLRRVNKNSHFAQTFLLMYYQLASLSDKERYYVMPIFQRIFGGGALADKISKYLRIENSLCYACGCSFVLADNFGMVIAGLKKENVENAISLIHKALNEMLHGDVSEEELNVQKNKFLSDLKLRRDSIYGLIDNYYFSILTNAPLFSEYEEYIKQISIKDLQQFARKMKYALEYVLEERDECDRD